MVRCKHDRHGSQLFRMTTNTVARLIAGLPEQAAHIKDKFHRAKIFCVANSLTEEFIFFDPNADLRQMSLNERYADVCPAHLNAWA